MYENGNANMRIKKVRRAQDGYTEEYPFPTKKGYKAKVVEKVTPEGRTATVKVRRTIGGFLSGKPRGRNIQMPAYNVPQRRNPEDSPERPPKKRYNTGNEPGPKIAKKGTKIKRSIVKPKSIKKKK